MILLYITYDVMKRLSGDFNPMKPALMKALLLSASLLLTACSSITESPTHKPATVETAQESIRNAPSSQTVTEEPNDQNTLQSVNLGATTSDAPVGGSIEKSMDPDDKIKMSRALDKAPGKTTSWTNNRTGMSYDVTPVRKVVFKNNPFCRTYQMAATRGSHTKEVSGTACVSEDGNWHPI